MSFDRYSQSLLRYPDLGFSLDLSRMDLTDEFHASMSDKITAAFEHLKNLEAGGIVSSRLIVALP